MLIGFLRTPALCPAGQRKPAHPTGLDMELAFAGKDLMILVVYRHYIDFGIAVKVIQPIGPYTGWRKWNFPVSAQVRKNGPADILISKGYKLLFKIFFDLVHDEPRELSNSSSPLYG